VAPANGNLVCPTDEGSTESGIPFEEPAQKRPYRWCVSPSCVERKSRGDRALSDGGKKPCAMKNVRGEEVSKQVFDKAAAQRGGSNPARNLKKPCRPTGQVAQDWVYEPGGGQQPVGGVGNVAGADCLCESTL